MRIQWYPGHMAKAMRTISENAKLIDVVIEVVDARAPQSCRNPSFEKAFRGKARVLILNKKDLADENATKQWENWFGARGIPAAGLNSLMSGAGREAIRLIEQAAKPAVQKYGDKGAAKTVRVMVTGIPNVGKSTFINCLSGERNAKTGAKPAVTRGIQWVGITPRLELMDTPGILPPRLDDRAAAVRLAFIGSIRDDIMDIEELAGELLHYLSQTCPEKISSRYKIDPEGKTGEELLEGVGRARGFLIAGGEIDLGRAARTALDEFRSGKLGRISLERPN